MYLHHLVRVTVAISTTIIKWGSWVINLWLPADFQKKNKRGWRWLEVMRPKTACKEPGRQLSGCCKSVQMQLGRRVRKQLQQPSTMTSRLGVAAACKDSLKSSYKYRSCNTLITEWSLNKWLLSKDYTMYTMFYLTYWHILKNFQLSRNYYKIYY